MMDKTSLFEWRKRVGEEEANRVSQRASNRGTRIHTLCENYLLGKETNADMFDHVMFKSLVPHLDKIDNIHALESKLYSDHLEVAGTVDCIAEYDGKLSVIDFKSSRRVKQKEDIPGYFIQTSAYAVAFEERTGIAVSRLVIIMGVDDDSPLIFIEKRDNWIEQFSELRSKYKRIKGI
jgi:genome maintenance exonuclease 1